MKQFYAGCDLDGQVKLFTEGANGRPEPVTIEEWPDVLLELGCRMGEMPLVTLSREIETETTGT